MKNKGFTLVELLVVILIIGILAAIAVPQYQKLVVKSHYSTIKNLAKSIAQAEESYYLSNGKYTIQEEDLDLSIPPYNRKYCNSRYCVYYYDWGSIILAYIFDEGRAEVLIGNSNIKMSYLQGFSQASARPNERLCLAAGQNDHPLSSDINYKICADETGGRPQSWGSETLWWPYKN